MPNRVSFALNKSNIAVQGQELSINVRRGDDVDFGKGDRPNSFTVVITPITPDAQQLFEDGDTFDVPTARPKKVKSDAEGKFRFRINPGNSAGEMTGEITVQTGTGD